MNCAVFHRQRRTMRNIGQLQREVSRICDGMLDDLIAKILSFNVFVGDRKHCSYQKKKKQIEFYQNLISSDFELQKKLEKLKINIDRFSKPCSNCWCCFLEQKGDGQWLKLPN